MSEDYLITIDGVVELDEAPADTMQLMTRGSFAQRGNSFFITYKESEATGYAGCTTTVKVSADGRKVNMMRFGPMASQLIIEKGTRHLCHYETGYGALNIGISADEIEHSLSPEGGSVRFSYMLDSDTATLSHNSVAITVKPVKNKEQEI